MNEREKKALEEFTVFWNHDLMLFAEKCIKDDSEIWANYKNAESEEDLDRYAVEMMKRQRIDWIALDKISTFIYAMVYMLAKDTNPIDMLKRFERIFNGKEYYQKVFKGNENCHEANMYREFGRKLSYGIEILTYDRIPKE